MKLPKTHKFSLYKTGRRTYYKNSYHLVFTTKHRNPYLNPVLKIKIRNWLRIKCEELNVRLLIMNGYRDHIHLLVVLPSTLSVSQFVKHAKGYTSFLMGKDRYWQSGYFSEVLDIDHIPRILKYIRNQYHHHSKDKVLSIDEWRELQRRVA